MDSLNDEIPEAQEKESLPIASSPPHDPFPKMIIVCFLITLFFLALVFFATLLDFAKRDKQVEIKPKNPAFFEEHLKTLPKSGAK